MNAEILYCRKILDNLGADCPAPAPLADLGLRKIKTVRESKPVFLTIVVPLFNEESNINRLFAGLKKVEENLEEARLEFIFVDDCSQDRTPELVRELCRQHSNVRMIRFAKNSGSHAAIMAGFVASKGDCVMFMAGDLQDPPEMIRKMLEQWQAGNGIVWAARTVVLGQKRQDTLFSSLYWQMVYYLNQMPLPKTGVDFVLVDRKVVEAIAQRHHCNIPYFQLVAETGFKSTVVFYTKGDRAGGKSGWTIKKKLSLVLDTLLFSPAALRAFTGVGVALAAISIVAALISAGVHFAAGVTVDPVWLVVMALGFFTGLQMTMLGFVGEYLFVSLKEARNAPRYVVAERCNFSEEAASPVSGKSSGSVVNEMLVLK